jgi:type I restriction enzyme M protein
LLTGRKAAARKGKVQLIDATSFWIPMRKSLGDKRREIPLDRAQDIVNILAAFKDGETRLVTRDGKEEAVVVSHIYPTSHFGFRKITVERPLRLNFLATPERLAGLDEEKGFQALAQSKKKGAAGAREQAEGRALQEAIRKLLKTLPGTLYKDRDEFERVLDVALKKQSIKFPAPARNATLAALSERDETADICRDKDGRPEADPELRDTESVPLPVGDDRADAEGVPASVRAFFEREVKPHVPHAWIDTRKCDLIDGRVGLIGYEINFNRYTPPRPLEAIEADIRGIGQDIVRMLGEVTAGQTG